MCRKLLICILLTHLITTTGISQRLSITTHAGYVFNDHINLELDEFSGKVQGGLQSGIGIEYSFNPSFGLELLYLRQDTRLKIGLPTGQETLYNLGINYILLTGNNYLKLGERLYACPGSIIGMALTKAESAASNNSTTDVKFTLGIKAGLVYPATKKISFRIQGTLLATIQAYKGTFYFGSSGVPFASLLQFNIGGGIAFHFPVGKTSSK